MIPLDHDRTGRQLVVVERATGHRREQRVVVHALAVQGGGDVVADDDRLERLPFTGWLPGVDVRSLPPVDRQQALTAARGRVADAERELQFVPAANVETAVLALIELE